MVVGETLICIKKNKWIWYNIVKEIKRKNEREALMKTDKRKRLPIGISDFKKVIEENYLRD